MNNKIINVVSILCVAVVVGVMSWRDMHRDVSSNPSPGLGVTAYYAGPDITPSMVPDDSLSITASLGEFSYTPAGKTVWTPHGMGPTTFAQRQLNPEFHFKTLPRNPAETINKIEAAAEEWVRKGDTINAVVIDYSPEKADLKSYAALIKAAHNELKKAKGEYVVFASINPQWTGDAWQSALKDLQDDSPQFLIHVPQANISPELFAKLEAMKHNFILQFPQGALPKDIDMASLKKLRSLVGITLTLDPHNPPPKKEEKIGLFPKL